VHRQTLARRRSLKARWFIWQKHRFDFGGAPAGLLAQHE